MDELTKAFTMFRKVPTLNEVEEITTRTDSQWLVNRFMVRSTDLSAPDDQNRYWSVVNYKFTDSSLGGNISINSVPQFTRYADIRSKGRVKGRSNVSVNDLNGDIGMGRYYGEAIDDNAVNVYLTFGVPTFNNLFNFLLSSVDYKKAKIVNEGRSTIPYDIAKTLGSYAVFAAFPYIVPFIWLAKTAYKFLLAPGSLDYYYMKETMPTYWSSVNTIVNLMSTELGLLSPMFTSKGKEPNKAGTPVKFEQDDLNFLKEYMPNILTENNGIDVVSIALKAQKSANRQFMAEMKMYEDGQLREDNFLGLIKDPNVDNHRIPQAGLTAKINAAMMTADYHFGKNDPDAEEDGEEYTPGSAGTFTSNKDGTLLLPDRGTDKPTRVASFKEYVDAELREGSRYLVLKVDEPGSITESFTNTVGDIGLDSGLKAASSKARDVKFNLAGGNLVPGMSNVLSYVGDAIVGSLDGLTMGLSNVLTYLLTDANLEFVKKWEDSSASFPETTFKMKLISPYKNPMSTLHNIYIPIACLLAGMLPRSTGVNSYGSPYLASMFLRGHQTITLGMITSLSITRGTSNLAFARDRQPLAVDVSFTVTDFSKIITAPTSDSLLDPGGALYNDTAPLNRYIASLCSRDLHTTKHVGPKTKLKISRFLNEVDHITSPAYFGMKIGAMTPEIFKSVLAIKGTNYTDNY